MPRSLGLARRAVAVVAAAAASASATWSTTTRCPRIEVDPETYEVRADGVRLTCEPATRAAHGPALLPLLSRVIVIERVLHDLAPRPSRATSATPCASPGRAAVDAQEAPDERGPRGGARAAHRHACSPSARCSAVEQAGISRWRASRSRSLAVRPRDRHEALRVAFEVGNRHFSLAVDGDSLLVPDDTAMTQLLDRLGVAWERRAAVYSPDRLCPRP